MNPVQNDLVERQYELELAHQLARAQHELEQTRRQLAETRSRVAELESILHAIPSGSPKVVVKTAPSQKHADNRKITKVLFVADPLRRIYDKEEALKESSWIFLTVSPSELHALKDLPGFYHKLRPDGKNFHVIMEGWVAAILLGMYREMPDVEVEFMEPSYYLRIIMDDPELPEKEQWWAFLIAFDHHIGGFDFSINYWTWGIPMTLEKMHAVRRGLRRLLGHVRIWPHPFEVEQFSNKVALAHNLELVAQALSSPRPKTSIYSGGPQPKNSVLKRTHSECGHHVYFPHQKWPPMDVLQQLPGPPDSVWLVQDYVPTIKQHGEFRAFVVGNGESEEIVYVVHTTHTKDGKFVACLVEEFYTLDMIQSLYDEHGSEAEFAVVKGSPPGSEEGRQEFFDFVGATWKAMVELEERQSGGARSSMRIFCRLDIAVWIDSAPQSPGDKKRKRRNPPRYVVNEIERSLAASLWCLLDGVPLQRFGRAFANALLVENSRTST